MTLREKILLVQLAVLISFVALGYGILQLIVFPSFTSLEQGEAIKDVQRCVDAIERERYHLDLLCDDWAAWDDTYEFVQSNDPEYVESNLVLESFTDNELNLIYVVDTDGRVVWGEIRDLETEKESHLPEFPVSIFPMNHPLLAHETVHSSVSGIILTAGGPMFISSYPIRTSENEGPIRGTFLMGRFLNEDVVETMATQANVDFRLWPARQSALPPDEWEILSRTNVAREPFISERGGDRLAIYITLPNLYESDTPGVLLRADIPRTITMEGTKALRFVLISVLVAVLVLQRHFVKDHRGAPSCPCDEIGKRHSSVAG